MNAHEISDDEFDDGRDDRSVTLDHDPGFGLEEVIDLTEETEFSLTEDDYLTDADIRRLLGNWRENQSTSTTSYNSHRTVTDGIWVNGILYEKGQSVKLRKKGRYLRIRSVIQYTSGEIFFQGWNMIKNSKHKECYMPKEQGWKSELVWITNENDAEISIFDVERFVTIHLTNYCDITTDPHQGRFCRLKETLDKRGGSIQYISHHEADEGFRWNPAELRRLWRGGTRPFGEADQFTAKFCQPVTDLTGPDDETARLRRCRWYTFGDGFCGAGGVSCGANQAGLEIKWAFDASHRATESYKLNFDNAECELGRIDHFLTNDQDFQRVDVSHGSPPCQTFSPAHTKEGRHDDENSACIFSCSDLIRAAKPRVHTMEETSGLLFDRYKETLSRVILDFIEMGYSVRWGLLYSVNYGVPQARKRLVIIASGPGELLPQFPEPTHGPRELGLKPYTTINQTIARIPTRAPDHDTQAAYPEPKAPYDGNRQAKTITCGGGEDYHPSGRRRFTNRELACLQTFPLEFRFGRIEVRKQIGNAVPPVLARALYAEIIRSLRQTDEIEMRQIEQEDGEF